MPSAATAGLEAGQSTTRSCLTMVAAGSTEYPNRCNYLDTNPSGLGASVAGVQGSDGSADVQQNIRETIFGDCSNGVDSGRFDYGNGAGVHGSEEIGAATSNTILQTFGTNVPGTAMTENGYSNGSRNMAGDPYHNETTAPETENSNMAAHTHGKNDSETGGDQINGSRNMAGDAYYNEADVPEREKPNMAANSHGKNVSSSSSSVDNARNFVNVFEEARTEYLAGVHGSENALFRNEDSDTRANLSACQKRIGIRLTRKRKACSVCNGPCGGDCSNNTEEIADMFLRVAAVAKRRKLQGNEAAARLAKEPTDTASSSNSTVLRPSPAVGRPKKRTKTSAPLNFGKIPEWLAADPRVGGTTIHTSHLAHLGWHRGLVWCWKCGNYATRVPVELKTLCDGPTLAGKRAIAQLRQGKPPTGYVSWPHPEL